MVLRGPGQVRIWLAYRKGLSKMKIVDIVLLFVLLVCIYVLGFNALDRSIDNQDKMLCDSAKVSGNEEYLKKCECYYTGGSIRCIRNGQ